MHEDEDVCTNASGTASASGTAAITGAGEISGVAVLELAVDIDDSTAICLTTG